MATRSTTEVKSFDDACSHGISNWSRAIGHHGELLQGTFRRCGTSLVRALVTLPIPSSRTYAHFEPTRRSDIRISPPNLAKASNAAKLTLRWLSKEGRGGELRLLSNIPVGHGYGSSTADVVATIKAVSNAYGRTLSAQTISMLAVAAETAADAIVFQDVPVLFAHREGQVLEYFGGQLPPLTIVSAKSPDFQPIDTNAYEPARYTIEELFTLNVARAAVRHAIRCGDPRVLGKAATLSARINQRHLPKSLFAKALDLARANGACGVQIAHSGSLFGFLVAGVNGGSRSKAAVLASAAKHQGFADVGILTSVEGQFDA